MIITYYVEKDYKPLPPAYGCFGCCWKNWGGAGPSDG